MSSIDPPGLLAAALAASDRLAAQRRLTARGAAAVGAPAQPTMPSADVGRSRADRAADTRSDPPGTPDAALLARIAALPSDDPQRSRRALRLWMRAALQRALHQGSPDSEFELLVDEVLARMAADAALAQELQSAGDRLIALAREASRQR